MQPSGSAEFGILGPLEVRVGAARPVIAGSRLRRLLVRLAVDAGATVPLGELLDAVWPGGSKPEGVANATQSLVSRLRRALGDPGLLQQSSGGYRLAVDPGQVDAHRFGRLAARGREELRSGETQDALTTIESALALWRGSALADADDASYADPVVARLNEQRVQANGDLFDAHIRLGRSADVVARLEELASADPLQEAFTGQLMTALAAAGRSAEALAAYERLRLRLAEELGVDPDVRLQEQHLALLRGELGASGVGIDDRGPASNRPAVPDPVGLPTNIRVALTSFIGREAELQRICGLLASGRLTTIIGPGGAGKTRLAAQAAAAWIRGPSPVPDVGVGVGAPASLARAAGGANRLAAGGISMVELAPITQASAIPLAMLSALGLREPKLLDRTIERAARDSIDRLLESLEGATVLLIMDNCEHLIGPVADLLDMLLARCPGVRVLATSREPLGIVGESICVIPPLGLPPVGATASVAIEYPAVQLLAERASAVSAGFRVDEGTVVDVVEVVRRLDGLPLAIELAAARLRVLPVSEIALRLGDRFRLLSGGNRTAMPRHRTLRAVVEWSWDLLTSPERLLAERLSVFPAGATEDAAGDVCSDDALLREDVPALLLSLVDKSLLQVMSDSPLRFRMLETIREYGIERLAERGEALAARTAHAIFFADLATRIEPTLRTRDQLAAMAILDAEQDNLVAALRFLGDSGDLDRSILLGLSLVWHWNSTGSHIEIITWMDFLLTLDGGTGHRWSLYLRAARAMSMISSFSADDPGRGADGQTEFALLAAELADAPVPPWPALVILGPILAFFGGDEKLALRLAEGPLASEDPWIRAAIRTMRASSAENRGDLVEMRDDVEEALADFESIGERWGLSTTLNSRAWIRTLDGDLPGAISDYERALVHLQALGGHDDDLIVHLRLGGLRLRTGEIDAARRSLRAARGVGTGGVFDALRQILTDLSEIGIRVVEGDLAGATMISEVLRQQVQGGGYVPSMRGHIEALVHSCTASVALLRGEIDSALVDLAIAYPASQASKDMPIVAVMGVVVSQLAATRGKWRDAAVMLGASARLRGGDDFTDVVITRLVAECRVAIGPEFDDAYLEGKLLALEAAIVVLDPAPYS
ncbi:putative ATPase/DNA-binding SARP family transcriptional activator [Nakamurella sp. UYEF19]|uniref:AfsR/SARP family transcriptional regulator n=1 Tax=Nakamurella sp. UYEF19 TaxID=1756392 RepID=UPI003398DE68